jgi:adenine specific DNA methylase Mod
LPEVWRRFGCGSGDLIVQGDNLVALKALLPYYAGQVKCIFIDPPYNTGKEAWIYNDNVNSPLIREWLGNAVGKEAEDLSRHDKWLCMMYPRLVLLKQFLREDGVIFVSIDDNEVALLRLLMDEILGAGNFIAHFVWEKRKNRENRKTVSVRHDRIIAYARDANQALSRFHLLPMNTEALARYKNPDNDKRGPWKSDPATAQAGHGTKAG